MSDIQRIQCLIIGSGPAGYTAVFMQQELT